MNLSTPTPEQLEELAKAVRLGLAALHRPPPMTAVEWANEHFYLSSESSYHEGKWETLPFQVAILNAMGNDEISVVNIIKSARLGYTKMALAAIGYLLEHKKRNCLTFSPTDDDRDKFSKTHVKTMIRDIPVVLELAPWHGKKHTDNTTAAKRFSNGKQLFMHGGKAARNYREISADVVLYDELAGFDSDIEKEGTATSLGDTRLEGSTFPKSIRGSTPKLAGTGPEDPNRCQISKAVDESPHLLRYNIACPHCGGEQVLKWGGKDEPYGFKWDGNDAKTVFYQCEHTACVIRQHEIHDETNKYGVTNGRYVCEKTGIWTRDSIDWFNADDELIPTPESVSFHIWAAYSPLNTWVKMVSKFLKSFKDPTKLKTFVNTTLGETWEDEYGEKLDWEVLYNRREVFPQVPNRAVGLFGGIDTQDDRYEGRVWAVGPGQEMWLVDRWILYGDPAGSELLKKVGERLPRTYTREDGGVMNVVRWCWDSGGSYTDEVYSQSKKHGLMWVVPIKGANVYGKPIASFPRKKTAKGVYLTEIGTDNAKEQIYNRLKIQPQAGLPVEGCIHLPANDELCDEDELKQLTAEVKMPRIVKGQRKYLWESGGRRNEALDCLVYALAALHISMQRFGFDLNQSPVMATPPPEKTPPPPPAAASGSGGSWLQTQGGSWL